MHCRIRKETGARMKAAQAAGLDLTNYNGCVKTADLILSSKNRAI